MIELQGESRAVRFRSGDEFLRGGRIGEGTAVFALIIGGGNGEPRARHTGSVRSGTDEPRRIGSPRGSQPHDDFRHRSAPDRRRCAGRNRARTGPSEAAASRLDRSGFRRAHVRSAGCCSCRTQCNRASSPSMARSSARTGLRCRKGTGRSRPSSEPIKKSMRSALAAATRKPLGVGVAVGAMVDTDRARSSR